MTAWGTRPKTAGRPVTPGAAVHPLAEGEGQLLASATRTDALQAGADVVELQALLRHACLDTTRRYLDATAQGLRHVIKGHPSQIALRHHLRTTSTNPNPPSADGNMGLRDRKLRPDGTSATLIALYGAEVEMGLFSPKPRGPAVVPVPTHMTDSWFDELIATAPAEAGLAASIENLSYIRDHLTLITIDEPIVRLLRSSRGAELRQYQDLISSTDSLGDRMAFLNGWGGPTHLAEMEKRIHRQRKAVIDGGREDGRLFDPARGDPRQAMKNTIAIAERMRR